MKARHGDGYIPLHPTDGWVLQELRALGHLNATTWTAAQRIGKLKELGYDVHEGPDRRSNEQKGGER